MHVVAFCSLKGGSGKTTLAVHLAAAAMGTDGPPPALVDCDPLGGVDACRDRAEGRRPLLVRASAGSLAHELQRLRSEGIRQVFVDTPPATGVIQLRAFEQSDLVVIPVRPGPLELPAAQATLELARRAGTPAVLVVNAAIARAPATHDTVAALAAWGSVAPVVVHHRAAFVTALADPRTVLGSDPGSRAAREIVELWRHLDDRLVRLANRHAFQQRRPAGRFFGRRALADGDGLETALSA